MTKSLIKRKSVLFEELSGETNASMYNVVVIMYEKK